jgi:uncharacterized membrane protein
MTIVSLRTLLLGILIRSMLQVILFLPLKPGAVLWTLLQPKIFSSSKADIVKNATHFHRC